jgi:hypothetical protein
VSDDNICGDRHPGLAWLDEGREMVCSLSPGHRGLHWGGRDGMQPWPRRKGLIHWPGPEELPNDAIGIRPYGGFCINKHPTYGECDLRFKHAGPHARRGKIWVAK